MAEALEIIKEEQNTPALSSSDINEKLETDEELNEPEQKEPDENCTCTKRSTVKNDSGNIDKVLQLREEELKRHFENQFERDISALKDKFDFILQ